MAPTTSWRGAIDITGDGLTVVNIALYSRLKKQRNDSFKLLSPDGQPVKQTYLDPAGNGYSIGQCRRGIEVGDTIVPLTKEALETINSGTRTKVAHPERFVPADQLPMELAIDRFAVRPDEKVPGSDLATNIVWNGLRKTGLAYLTVMSLKGGHDSILALYATDNGFWGVLLPFEEELNSVPAHRFTPDDEQADLLATVMEQKFGSITGGWDHAAFKSEYRERRQAAIDSVLNDTPAPTPKPDKAPAADLMAVLAASIHTNQEVAA